MESNQIILGVIITTLVIFLLIVTVVVIMLLASRQRTRMEVQMAQARLAYEQELRTIETETQEATLTHLSSELHDNIGQLLTVIRLQIEKAQIITPGAVDTLAPISGSLNAAIKQVRLLSHSLDTDFIVDGGLLKAIGSEAQRLQAIGTHGVSFTHDGGEPTLSKDQRTVVFRIVQEILSNSLRHASAKNIAIHLQSTGELLRISDDGKGFDKEAVLEASHGLGLKNMLKRAQLAGLHLSIDSSAGQGSLFTLSSGIV